MTRSASRESGRRARNLVPPCSGHAHSYNSAVLDIKLIREKPEFVRQRLATRGAGDERLIDGILQADEARRKALAEVEALKATRNRVSKEIGALMGQKKLDEAEAKKKETRDLGDRITALDAFVKGLEGARESILMRLPNLPHAKVALGKSSTDNPTVRVWGERRLF